MDLHVLTHSFPTRRSSDLDFESPWAMAFLPDGRMLVTEKAGEMILFDPKNGTKIPVAGIPPVDSAGQGALMDVVPAPGFAKNGTVYFSFSEASAEERRVGNGCVSKGRLRGAPDH